MPDDRRERHHRADGVALAVAVAGPRPCRVTVPIGSTWWYASFHSRRAASALYVAAGDTGDESKSPMSATPVLPALKPPACAPITALLMPPYRPSNTWPKRSMRKLYPMSHQPLTCVWK